ncbi:PseG/SpsG family protein [Sphingomicrobium aestuariivivum]|uniref:PseG/SpsG family protein n=1 Tax=Sphingomicrobium aestuariivivum TaxID=1582356 RepID=UPI001FD6BA29|nr:hypothetical protein [Sphingomicrobium aestuariivivum]MCJ8190775.1 hypothetical protein [Sphingomicrobium aestuariivivum]
MSGATSIAIRADAGRALGTGHFARAAALVEALRRDPGVEVTLLTARDSEPFLGAFFGDDLPVVLVDDAAPDQALELLLHEAGHVSALCLDHYDDVGGWEVAARTAGMPLMVIDDLDQARQADRVVRLHEAGPGEGRWLRGPAFAPLSPTIRALAPVDRETAGTPVRVNVCFGGTDPTGETAKAVAALRDMDGVAVDLVIGPGTRLEDRDLEAARRADHVRLHHAPDKARLAGLLARADLALGAGGVMLWERACLGLPSLVVEVADNQHAQVMLAERAGAIRFLGTHEEVEADAMHRAIGALVGDAAARRDMARQAAAMVDGKGAERLAATLVALARGQD